MRRRALLRLYGVILEGAAKAQSGLIRAALDVLVQAIECTAADEKDVGGIDLDKLLLGVLAAALGRHIAHGALQDLQQRLLHALTAHVAGDGGVLALAGDLIDLVDIDDADLRLLHIKVRCLDQLEQDVLHILAHIAGLGQGGGVGDRKGNAQHLGQRLGQQGLADAGGAQQQDVALLQLHVARLCRSGCAYSGCRPRRPAHAWPRPAR